MTRKKTLIADLSLLLVAFVWGSGFVVTKNALDHMTPYYLLGFRFLIATFFLFLVSYKRLKKAKMADIKAGAVVGILMFIGFILQTIGLQHTTVGVQAFIISSNVVLVPFFYWILTRKKPTSFEIGSAVICFIGVGILSFDANMHMGYGELLSLLSTVFFAMQVVAVDRYAKDADCFVLSTVQMAITTVGSFALAFMFEPKITQLNNSIIIPMLYLGIFSSMLAFLGQNIAQKYTSATHVAIIFSTEAVFGSILGVIFLKEVVTTRFLIGCAAVLAAVLFSELKPDLSKLYRQKPPV
ncbi:MAG: DMT family transporter [Gudongella sp.]|jgi:drug/metabolite transporter (DMT)-like permease|nr:DMT family transporter [Gudongella sp.]